MKSLTWMPTLKESIIEEKPVKNGIDFKGYLGEYFGLDPEGIAGLDG